MYKEKNNVLVGAIMYVVMFLSSIDLLICACKQSETSSTDFSLIIIVVVISIIADLIAAYFLYKNKRQNGLGVSLWIIQNVLFWLVVPSHFQIGTENFYYVFLDIISFFFIIMFFKTQKTVFKVLPTIVMVISAISIGGATIASIITGVFESMGLCMPLLLVLFVLQCVLCIIQINQSFEKDLNYVPGLTEFSNADNTDLLLEYEELLDMGAITPAEFEEKKKELLG